MSDRLISLFGLIVFIGISYLASNNRKSIPWNTVLWGVALQLILGVLILKTTTGLAIFQFLGSLVRHL